MGWEDPHPGRSRPVSARRGPASTQRSRGRRGSSRASPRPRAAAEGGRRGRPQRGGQRGPGGHRTEPVAASGRPGGRCGPALLAEEEGTRRIRASRAQDRRAAGMKRAAAAPLGGGRGDGDLAAVPPAVTRGRAALLRRRPAGGCRGRTSGEGGGTAAAAARLGDAHRRGRAGARVNTARGGAVPALPAPRASPRSPGGARPGAGGRGAAGRTRRRRRAVLRSEVRAGPAFRPAGRPRRPPGPRAAETYPFSSAVQGGGPAAPRTARRRSAPPRNLGGNRKVGSGTAPVLPGAAAVVSRSFAGTARFCSAGASAGRAAGGEPSERRPSPGLRTGGAGSGRGRRRALR